MSLAFSLPESCKIVDGSVGPVTTNGGVTCDSVSLKNCHKAYIVAKFRQAVSHTTVIQPKIGATVATATTNITFSAKWWKNADVATDDTLVAQTAAASMACTAGTTHQLLIVEIDPAQAIAQSATADCLGCTISDSSQATNFVDVTYWLVAQRYAQATPPSAIVD